MKNDISFSNVNDQRKTRQSIMSDQETVKFIYKYAVNRYYLLGTE
jgi:hypothetical protein